MTDSTMGTKAMSDVREITISVVSHGQMALVRPLLEQLQRISLSVPLDVIATCNLPEQHPVIEQTDRFRVTWIDNEKPKGFAENHNFAFRYCETPFYCVLNPDIRLEERTLLALKDVVSRRAGVAGPRVCSPQGSLEDSARRVPTLSRLLARWLLRQFDNDYAGSEKEQPVDWLAGMFLMFDSKSYARAGGFDTSYRLYCEDVEICLRMHLMGLNVTWLPEVEAIHDARRMSHRNWRYRIWHLRSMMGLLTSRTYWRFRWKHLHTT